jgi:hypothetical protein
LPSRVCTTSSRATLIHELANLSKAFLLAGDNRKDRTREGVIRRARDSSLDFPFLTICLTSINIPKRLIIVSSIMTI